MEVHPSETYVGGYFHSPTYSSVQLSIRLIMYRIIHPFIHLSIKLFMHPSIKSFLHPTILLFLYPFIYPCVTSFTRLSIYTCLFILPAMRSFSHLAMLHSSLHPFLHSFIYPSIHLFIPYPLNAHLFMPHIHPSI